MRWSSLSATRTTRTSRRSSPSRRPCGALLSFGEFLPYMIARFMSFYKPGVTMLAVEITENDRQHTLTPRLCSSRAKRVDKDPEDQAKSRIHELKECIRIISMLSSYLGFRVANTFISEYWSSEQLDGEHDSFPFLCTWSFCNIFKTGGMLSSPSTNS